MSVGDSLNLARDRYPRLSCERQYYHDEGDVGDPYCTGPLGPDLKISSWGNPIDSLGVSGRRRG